MESQADAILVASSGSDAFVRVVGRGTFKGSPSLKKFGLAEIERGCRRIVLDMKDCQGMDSTFMGVLAGLAVHIKRRTQGEIQVIRLSGKNLALLETLGLTHLIRTSSMTAEGEASPAAAGATTRLETGALDKNATTETMLTAHETLVSINPENLPKFKDVLAYLRDEMKQIEAAPPGGG